MYDVKQSHFVPGLPLYRQVQTGIEDLIRDNGLLLNWRSPTLSCLNGLVSVASLFDAQSTSSSMPVFSIASKVWERSSVQKISFAKSSR